MCSCVTVNRNRRHSCALFVCHCQLKQKAQLCSVRVSLSTETEGTAVLCSCVTVNRNRRRSSAIPQTGRIVVTFPVVSEHNIMFLRPPSICFQSPFADSNQTTSHLRISPNHTEDTKTIQRTLCGQVIAVTLRIVSIM